MKAVLLDGFGDASVLRIAEVEPPRLEAGEVMIRVVATSVNRPDVLQRQGSYPPPPGESEILGLEAAGRIAAVAADVRAFEVGQPVAALLGGGGYAEFATAHAGHVVPIPESMSFDAAACLCETYITAYMNLFLGADLCDGETLLVHGGAGGVGTAAIQLARNLTPEARVVATASAAKSARVAALGVERVVDYGAEDFVAALLEVSGGRGADVILDHIGASYLARNMQALAIGGRLALIGVMGGRKAELDLGRLLVKRQRIIGSTLRPRPPDEKAAIVSRYRRAVLPLFTSGRLAPIIDRVYPIEDVAAAHTAMERGEHFGKLVLRL